MNDLCADIGFKSINHYGEQLCGDHVDIVEQNENSTVIVVEEVCTGSGIKEALAWELVNEDPACRVAGIDLGADFVTHGNQKKLYECTGLDAASIAAYTKEVLSK